MTKLMEWLSVLAVLFGVWLALVSEIISNSFTKHYYNTIYFSPFYLVFLFGLWSLGTILYNVANFNDCNEAAEELTKEIQEAKADLTKRNFRFRETVLSTSD